MSTVIYNPHDLIPSPAFSLLSAGKTFQHPTHRPNELWQTDFTSLQVVGWGWDSLSTVLDDSSCDIVAWTLRTSMQASAGEDRCRPRPDPASAPPAK